MKSSDGSGLDQKHSGSTSHTPLLNHSGEDISELVSFDENGLGLQIDVSLLSQAPGEIVKSEENFKRMFQRQNIRALLDLQTQDKDFIGLFLMGEIYGQIYPRTGKVIAYFQQGKIIGNDQSGVEFSPYETPFLREMNEVNTVPNNDKAVLDEKILKALINRRFRVLKAAFGFDIDKDETYEPTAKFPPGHFLIQRIRHSKKLYIDAFNKAPTNYPAFKDFVSFLSGLEFFIWISRNEKEFDNYYTWWVEKLGEWMRLQSSSHSAQGFLDHVTELQAASKEDVLSEQSHAYSRFWKGVGVAALTGLVAALVTSIALCGLPTIALLLSVFGKYALVGLGAGAAVGGVSTGIYNSLREPKKLSDDDAILPSNISFMEISSANDQKDDDKKNNPNNAPRVALTEDSTLLTFKVMAASSDTPASNDTPTVKNSSKVATHSPSSSSSSFNLLNSQSTSTSPEDGQHQQSNAFVSS